MVATPDNFSTPPMPPPRKRSPFTPGMGLNPPLLAGRAAEQARLTRAMHTIAEGDPHNAIIMYGPRGVGKTVLQHWLRVQCERGGIVVAKTQPLKRNGELPIESLHLLLDAAPAPGAVTHTESQTTQGGGTMLGFKIGGRSGRQTTATWSAADHTVMARAEAALAAACKHRPRVFIIDEAHNLNEDARVWLFNLTQNLIEAGAPFLLLTLGTPGLRAALEGATFAERATYLPVGLISPAAAAEAVRVPLQEHGNITIDDEALATVARDSQGYPYFVQLWGDALWGYAADNKLSRLSQTDIDAVMPTTQEEKNDFYANRYTTHFVHNDDLRLAAEVVAQAFEAKASNTYDSVALVDIIDEALAETYPDLDRPTRRREHAHPLLKALERIDFVWQEKVRSDMIPGIPSFMTYALHRRDRTRRQRAGG